MGRVDLDLGVMLAWAKAISVYDAEAFGFKTGSRHFRPGRTETSSIVREREGEREREYVGLAGLEMGVMGLR